MLNVNETGNAEPREILSARRENEAMLRSEVGFWRDLIDGCDDTQPPESIERMHQALALAERRLRRLFQVHQQTDRDARRGRAEVYYLDTTRRQSE